MARKQCPKCKSVKIVKRGLRIQSSAFSGTPSMYCVKNLRPPLSQIKPLSCRPDSRDLILTPKISSFRFCK